jgi:hypothetical protein
MLSFHLAVMLVLPGCTDPSHGDVFDGRLLASLNNVHDLGSDPWIEALGRLGPRLQPALSQLGPPAETSFLPAAAFGRQFVWDQNLGEYALGGAATEGTCQLVIYSIVPGTTVPSLPLQPEGILTLVDRYPTAEFTVEAGSATGSRWDLVLSPGQGHTEGRVTRGGRFFHLSFDQRTRPDSTIRDLRLRDPGSGLEITAHSGGMPGIEAVAVDLTVRGPGGELGLRGVYDVRGPNLVVRVDGIEFARITLTSRLQLVIERLDGRPLAPGEDALLVRAESLMSFLDALVAAWVGTIPIS